MLVPFLEFDQVVDAWLCRSRVREASARWVRMAVMAGFGTGMGIGSVARRSGMSRAVSTA
jgi:hypothetical protein